MSRCNDLNETIKKCNKYELPAELLIVTMLKEIAMSLAVIADAITDHERRHQ